jgi:hypothetical protein
LSCLFFFFWTLSCLFFFYLWILNTFLVSSSLSWMIIILYNFDLSLR